MAANTSKLFNLLFELVRETASRIDRQGDINIIDMHDNMKPDAPSGTSKQIAEIISYELNYESKDYTYGKNVMGIRKAEVRKGETMAS